MHQKIAHVTRTARVPYNIPIKASYLGRYQLENHTKLPEMDTYAQLKSDFEKVLKDQPTWNAISADYAARMKAQNRFQTGLDIAKYCAKIMRKDMAEYDQDPTKYTQSLGCWHGFVAQQCMISVKKHFGTTSKKYLYLSGWMIAAMRSKFGPLPDQVIPNPAIYSIPC